MDERAPATPETVVHPEAAVEPPRPLPVSLTVILVMVLAGLGVLEGILILLSRYDDAAVEAGLVMAISLAGAAGILLSLLLGAVAAAVWRGSRAARIIVTIVAAAAIALDVVTILGSPANLWWTVIDAVFYLLVIVALWTGSRTAAFFKPRRRALGEPAAAS